MINVNGEMKVGNVAETVNVSGEAPVVDTQTTKRQAVLENKTINELPVARGYGAILAAVPTLQGAGASSSSSVNPSFFTAHGGPGNEGAVQLDGLNVGAAFNGGGVSGNAYDVANAQEMQIAISGNLGDAETGGPILNIVPKTGGNQFKGTFLRHRRRQLGAGQQRRRRPARAGRDRSRRPDQAVGRQRGRRRADQAGQAVVLSERARLRQPHADPRPLREQVSRAMRRTGTTRPIRPFSAARRRRRRSPPCASRRS